jgi:hypothetical protein
VARKAGAATSLRRLRNWSGVSVWALHLELRREAKDDGVHLTCEVDTYALQDGDAPAP